MKVTKVRKYASNILRKILFSHVIIPRARRSTGLLRRLSAFEIYSEVERELRGEPGVRSLSGVYGPEADRAQQNAKPGDHGQMPQYASDSFVVYCLIECGVRPPSAHATAFERCL